MQSIRQRNSEILSRSSLVLSRREGNILGGGVKKGFTDTENLATIFADGQKLIVLYYFIFMAQLKLLGKNLLESQKFLIQ